MTLTGDIKRKKTWEGVLIAASGVASALTLLGMVAHYGLGYELFRFTGLLFVWEVAWGWITLVAVVLLFAWLQQILSRHTNIPPVVSDEDSK